jgi:hypothetical protein
MSMHVVQIKSCIFEFTVSTNISIVILVSSEFYCHTRRLFDYDVYPLSIYRIVI